MADSASRGAPTRRDSRFIAAGATGVVAAPSAVWPLIDRMNPAASILAAASTEVDLSHIAEAQIVAVKWRGKPAFMRHRTAKEIAESRAVPLSHRGPYDGWFCPCHGSVYDLVARIRQGPAPYNRVLPSYEFISDSKISIG